MRKSAIEHKPGKEGKARRRQTGTVSGEIPGAGDGSLGVMPPPDAGGQPSVRIFAFVDNFEGSCS